jgi:uncharacterized protein YkwD
MSLRVAVVTAILAGVVGSSTAFESQSSPTGTSADTSTSNEGPTKAFLEAINDLRWREQSAALRYSELLSQAAEVLLDKALAGPVTHGFDSSARLTLDDLRALGYDPHQWADGLASSTGEPAEIVDFWQQADPEGFNAFLDPGLQDFGLAKVTWGTQPLYALVAATSRSATNRPILEALSDLETVRRQLLDRVNEERRLRRIGPLHPNGALNSAAQIYAERMMREGFYGHVSPQGDTVLDRVEASGYEPQLTGENLASGPQTTVQVMEGWMASKGHRENILDPRFRDVGFGVSVRESNGDLTILWVQCFGRP